MSKMHSGYRTARGDNMSNLSATIIRNVVSSVFNVESSKVVLSGILPETYDKSEDNSFGNLYAMKQDLKMFAYTVEKGFTEIFGTATGYSQNADGTYSPEYRITFAECQMYKEAQFFVEYFYNEGWQEGNPNWNMTTVKVYGAPDWNVLEKRTARMEHTRLDWKLSL